jgi:hypothetical protein
VDRIIEEDSLKAGGISYFIMLAVILIAAVMMAGCNAPTGTRCITAWGLWTAPFGQPLGLGYWNSAHGDNVHCGGSTAPPEIYLLPPTPTPEPKASVL